MSMLLKLSIILTCLWSPFIVITPGSLCLVWWVEVVTPFSFFMFRSPFGSALSSFKQDFENEFAGRPTVKPDVRKFMQVLEKKYKDAKKGLYGLRPTGRPSKDAHDLFHQAKELVWSRCSYKL